VNEFEAASLRMVQEQNETLKRLERALTEQGKTMLAVLSELQALGQVPNVVQLTSRVRRVEGDMSELRGKVVRLDADVERLAAAGSDAE
jgi:DNA-binding HxlR family transcriptional regulator